MTFIVIDNRINDEINNYRKGEDPMACSYKYRIICDQGYYFELLPNNSNSAFVGRSGVYGSVREAVAAIRLLKSFLADKQVIPYSIELDPCAAAGFHTNRFRAVFAFAEKDHIFFTRSYCRKCEVKNGVDRILKNYHADICMDM